MDDSVITCDGIIEETVTANFNERKATCKTQNLDILLVFLLITIALLIAVSIYYCLTYIEHNKNIHYHFTTQIRN